jgi:hypothetical protein
MKKTLSIMTESFVNESTGEEIEGVTVMIDGLLREVIGAIRRRNSSFDSTAHVVQEALVRGLDSMRLEV